MGIRFACSLSLKAGVLAPTIALAARVAELADARDLGSRGETLEGSSPSSRTTSLALARDLASPPVRGSAKGLDRNVTRAEALTPSARASSLDYFGRLLAPRTGARDALRAAR
jgi:hypothetical protein